MHDRIGAAAVFRRRTSLLEAPLAARPRGWRVAVRRVHLWLGLALGLLFAVAGLTGSVLVFYNEIDGALVPALRAVPAGTRPSSWQAVVDQLHRDHPTRTGPWRIEVTPAGGAIPIRYYAPRETRDRAFAPLMLWLDPQTLHTVRAGFWGQYPTTWLYALHWQLLSGRTGEAVMGVAGLGVLLMLATGLATWWPRPGQLRRALRWKPDAGPSRRLYDLHKLAGLGALPVLLVVVATGVALEFPAQLPPLLRPLSPTFTPPARIVAPRPGGTLSVDRLADIARTRFPSAELAWIETPATATSPIRINLWQPGEPSRRFPRTNVWLDPYRGTVLAVRDGRREPPADVVLNWLHPLHSGEGLGFVGRLLVLASGLCALLLAATGLLRWALSRSRGAREDPAGA